MISNSTVKYIQSLQQKKFRDEYGVFVAEGPKLVLELLESGNFTPRAVYGLAKWLEVQNMLVKGLPTASVFEISEGELYRISGLKTPHSCLAIFEKRKFSSSDTSEALILMLDAIQDPGNLGTIIRTADWFGVTQIICSMDTTDCYNPKVVQSTMASLGRVEVIYANLPLWLDEHTEKELICTSLQGVPLKQVSPGPNQVIVIGNEARGVDQVLLNRASRQLTIPGAGKAESLNAAVATGIILAHFSRI